MRFDTSQRWWISFPFILALASLLFIIYSVSLNLTYPHDGILDYSVTDGTITDLDDFGKNFNHLQTGDIILLVDGKPFADASPFYAGKRAGDQALLIVDRGGERLAVTIDLIKPPLEIILSAFIPLVVALSFWLVGLIVQAYNPRDEDSRLFFLFCLASAILLTAGTDSVIGPAWTSSVFNITMWIIGPLAVHFHLHFPQTNKNYYKDFLLAGLYGFGLLGGLPYLIFGAQAVWLSNWYSGLSAGSQLFLVINMMIVLALLFHANRHNETLGARGKIRIIVLGSCLSLLPLITLVILPSAVLEKPILPFKYGILLLIVLPLTYGYSIVRHRLIEFDKHINRGATYILVYSLLGAFYLVFYSIIHRLPLPDVDYSEPVINVILVLFLAGVFVPLRQRMQRIVDTAFYGGWYEYRSAISQITQDLNQFTDLASLATVIRKRMEKTLRLEEVWVFLRDSDGEFSIIESGAIRKLKSVSFSNLPKKILKHLPESGVVKNETLQTPLLRDTLSIGEIMFIRSERIQIWVPIAGHHQVLGLLALGPKFGGDAFSEEDMDILLLFGRQLGTVIENIHLLTRLRRYAAELEKRVEERTAELHAAKERVEAVLSSVGDGVIVFNLDGKIVRVNQAIEEQTGYNSAEVVGREFYSWMMNGNGNGEKSVEIQTALKDQQRWSGELEAKRKDGHLYEAHLTIQPVRNQSGEIMGYVGSQRDITQNKQLERLKDQFILEVSHELRTPVTNMGLFVELLQFGRAEKKDEYLGVLKTEIDKLSHMIEDILDLSRLEVVKRKGAGFSPVDLNELVDQVINAYSPLALEAGLELSFECCRQLPSVQGDPNQLARVLTNLVSNAIRYTPSGWIRIRTYPEGVGVTLEVEDTGIGIDPEDFPHLFDRFFRGKRVSQSQIIGSGLGLSIVKEIVDIHGGQIEFESEVGKGTAFRVWFPC